MSALSFLILCKTVRLWFGEISGFESRCPINERDFHSLTWNT